VLESLPDEVVSVDAMMDTWKGRYDEMFEKIDNHIQDSERDEFLFLKNAVNSDTVMVTDNDDLSTSQSLFIEDIAIIPIHAPVVDIIVDHEHAYNLALHNKIKEHVQNRKETDQEKDTSGREKAGGNNKLLRATRQQSKGALEN
jgi:hypothetical protein